MGPRKHRLRDGVARFVLDGIHHRAGRFGVLGAQAVEPDAARLHVSREGTGAGRRRREANATSFVPGVREAPEAKTRAERPLVARPVAGAEEGAELPARAYRERQMPAKVRGNHPNCHRRGGRRCARLGIHEQATHLAFSGRGVDVEQPHAAPRRRGRELSHLRTWHERSGEADGPAAAIEDLRLDAATRPGTEEERPRFGRHQVEGGGPASAAGAGGRARGRPSSRRRFGVAAARRE